MWPIKTNRSYEELEEEIRKLKRMVEERDLDWVDMRSRCKRLLDRTEKAAKAMQPAVESEPATESQNGAEGALTTMGRALTPRQMKVQQEILRRRAFLPNDRS